MEIPEGEKYTIVTGGAQGADAYAERLALAYECKLEIKIGPNHPRAKCISPIVPVYADLLNAQRAAIQARKALERNVEVGKGGYFDELLIRNYFIAKDSCFVCLWILGIQQDKSSRGNWLDRSISCGYG